MTTKVTKKVKEKTKAAPAATSGQITEMVHKIENLTSESAFTEAKSLLDAIEENSFRIGGILAVMQEKGWFTEKGYADFRECVEKEFGLQYRKAMYLISIYNNLVASGIEWNSVKHLGWTKVATICPILTPGNLDKLVKKAEEATVIQLQEYVHAQKEKAAAKAKGEDVSDGDTSGEVTTMTFKVHKDQRETIDEAIERAKKEKNTPVATVALEYICMDYLQAPVAKDKAGKPAKDMKTMMSEAGYEKVLQNFEELWPEINVAVEA